MKKQRTNFSFRFEWKEKIAHLSPLVRLEVYEGAAIYAQTGSVPQMSAEALEVFNAYVMPDFRKRERAAMYRERAKARKMLIVNDETPDTAVEAKTDDAPECIATEEPAEEPAQKAAETKQPVMLNRRQRRRREQELRRLSRKQARLNRGKESGIKNTA